MPKDPGEIVVGANGTVWTAPVGTAAPADESAAPGPGWFDAGYTSEDGVTITDGKDLEVVNVWQLFYAARRIITGRDFTAALVLRQWNRENFSLAFGGGTWTESGTAGSMHYRYTPPDPGRVDERAMLIDWIDDDAAFRLFLPRGMVTENVETNIVRTAAADLPITFGILGSDVADPWYFSTNHPAFAAAA